MFSESEEDPLMGVATATESRAVERLVYLPADKLGMRTFLGISRRKVDPGLRNGHCRVAAVPSAAL